MFLDAKAVKRDFVRCGILGKGSDGAVEKYKHRRIASRCIAVKFPAAGNDAYRKAIQDEIRVMKNLQHPNVVQLLGYDDHWIPYGPALFYEFCEYGDMFNYHTKLVTMYGYVPEESLWKYFADMSKALNYLHNEQNVSLVHGDIKPENVLVVRPTGCVDTLPRTPIFKVADLARAVPYSSGSRSAFNGTPEYAPPLAEREMGATPAGDIWGLGATMQQLALGVKPTLQWETFVKVCPELQQMRSEELRQQDPQDQHWRARRPCIYRPLNVNKQTLALKWDWDPRKKSMQYSNALNRWYTMCFEKDTHRRISSAELVKWLVPVAERQIAVLEAKRKSDRLNSTIQLLREPMLVRKLPDPCPIPRRKPLPPPLPPRAHARMQVAAPNSLLKTALEFNEERSPVLRREDFGLPPRRPLIKRSSTQNTEKSLRRREIEQRYLKGMKPKPK